MWRNRYEKVKVKRENINKRKLCFVYSINNVKKYLYKIESIELIKKDKLL